MMYKLSNIRCVCETYYGRAISDRTWLYWKSLANVEQYSREVPEQKASHIFAVAILRKRYPNKKINFVDVLKCALNEIPRIKEQLQNPKINLPLDSCEGVNLPDYLEKVTGKLISEKTLYRWGTRYGIPYARHKIYKSNDLNQWEILAKTVAA